WVPTARCGRARRASLRPETAFGSDRQMTAHARKRRVAGSWSSNRHAMEPMSATRPVATYRARLHRSPELALAGDREAAVGLHLDLQRLGQQPGAVIDADRIADLDDLLGREEF